MVKIYSINIIQKKILIYEEIIINKINLQNKIKETSEINFNYFFLLDIRLPFKNNF